jgi:hypothetical protein
MFVVPGSAQHPMPAILCWRYRQTPFSSYRLLSATVMLLFLQSASALRDHLRKHNSLPYSSRLADMHLLLWLAAQPNLDQADMLAVAEAVRDKAELMEGYKVIIDSIAGV